MLRWLAGILVSGALLKEPLASQTSALYRAHSDLVLVPAVVTDRNYKPIFDLKADQFELRVDRAPTPLAGFWRDTGPLSVVIVLDASQSMEKPLALAKDAIRGFLDLAHPDDEYAVIHCRRQGVLALDFAQDHRAVLAAVLDTAAGGGTPLFDSVKAALDLVKRGRHERRAILVITDGEDTTSRTKFKALRREVMETTAYLNVLQFWLPRPPQEPVMEPMRELAELTGGLFLDNVSPKRFVEHISALDLHERYVLAFRPPPSGLDGQRHRVDVRLRENTLPKAKVFFRRGYADNDTSEAR